MERYAEISITVRTMGGATILGPYSAASESQAGAAKVQVQSMQPSPVKVKLLDASTRKEVLDKTRLEEIAVNFGGTQVEFIALLEPMMLPDIDRERFLMELRAAPSGAASEAYGRLPDVARADKELALEALRLDARCLGQGMHHLLRADRDVVLAAVQRSGLALKHASEELKADKDVAWAAIRNNVDSFRFCLGKLRSDAHFLSQVVALDERAFEYAEETAKGQAEVVMAILRTNVASLQYAHQALRADRSFMVEALQANALALQFATDDLRADRDLALLACGINVDSLRWAHTSLKSDRSFLIDAVAVNPRAMEYSTV